MMHEEIRQRLTELEAEAKKTGASVLDLTFHQKAQTKILTEICRNVKKHETGHAKHELRISKIETHLMWVKAIGTTVLAAMGIHFTWK